MTIHIYHTQKGESCLNYTETLRNRVILGSILEEYKKQGVSVDVESLVLYIHTSAMHNIIASKRSGAECERDEIYVHCEITLTRI